MPERGGNLAMDAKRAVRKRRRNDFVRGLPSKTSIVTRSDGRPAAGKGKRRAAAALVAIGSTRLLSGCAATRIAIEKHDLDVQARMSDSIFLDPVSDGKKTVFVQVRNMSDKQDFDVSADVKDVIAARGYRVVGDPDKA